MKTRADRSTALLVVGAGPVGLLAALAAARAGIEVTILEQTELEFSRRHATVLHPAAVRLLGELGLGSEIVAEGRTISSIVVRANGGAAVRLELPSAALAVAQGVLEKALYRALRRAGVAVWSPVEASLLQQEGSDVRVRACRRELVTLGSPAEYSDWQPFESFVINARYAIGADGYESRVRSALGIQTVPVGPTESFALFECATDADLDHCMEVAFIDGLASSSLPLVNEHARLGFQIVTELDLPPDDARFRALAPQRVPWLSAESLRAVDWGSVTHFEQRLARRFGHGRVWLAGDAAHVTHPFGAQSMNVGLTEVAELVQRIGACLRGDGGDEHLRAYGLARQREWHELFGCHVKLDVLPHAPPWLAAHAHRIAQVLPVSGVDRKKVLNELGLKIS